ncbi:hypothetical protein, conserved [Leishmania tarentolae]|uniref:Uncharacterized protein n=1 Tax=Leishmania tarentolae TaxID=5689 RepID=A0A640KGX8_LEITA|nr:hypothetical protein, conserved [Leishmania tarentolae]
MMTLRHHLFNRCEVVAVFLDFEDATLSLTDMALPVPHPALASSLGAAASAYVPPLTRLDLVREALVAFVRAKMRSVPRTALLTFSLYIIRAVDAGGKGQESGEVVLQELLAPGPAGVAGSRLMQAAIEALNPTLWGPSNNNESCAASSSLTVYAGVVRCLKRLLEEAEQAQRQSADEAMPWMPKSASVTALANSSSGHMKGVAATIASSDNKGLPCASQARGGPSSTAAALKEDVCVVVHGIVLRSRQCPLAPLSSRAQAKASTTSCNTDCTPTRVAPRCWLDIVSLDPSGSVAQRELACFSPNTRSTAATAVLHERSSLLSTELGVDNACACALLDPVELTGIDHCGLALGPALARLISLKERHTESFMRTSIAVVDLLAFAAAPADAGDGAAAPKRGSTFHTLYAPATEPVSVTTGATSSTSHLASSPQPPAPSASSRRSNFPPLLRIGTGDGSSSAQSSCPFAPGLTTHNFLPDVSEQRGTAPAARSPKQLNSRKLIRNSATSGDASADPWTPLKVLFDEVKVDPVMRRRGSTAADEIPFHPSTLSTNAPPIPLNREVTYDSGTQRRRAQAARIPSGQNPAKGSPRPQPHPPHQRPLTSDIRSGDAMLSSTQVQSTSAAGPHQQVRCQNIPPL